MKLKILQAIGALVGLFLGFSLGMGIAIPTVLQVIFPPLSLYWPVVLLIFLVDIGVIVLFADWLRDRIITTPRAHSPDDY